MLDAARVKDGNISLCTLCTSVLALFVRRVHVRLSLYVRRVHVKLSLYVRRVHVRLSLYVRRVHVRLSLYVRRVLLSYINGPFVSVASYL